MMTSVLKRAFHCCHLAFYWNRWNNHIIKFANSLLIYLFSGFFRTLDTIPSRRLGWKAPCLCSQLFLEFSNWWAVRTCPRSLFLSHHPLFQSMVSHVQFGKDQLMIWDHALNLSSLPGTWCVAVGRYKYLLRANNQPTETRYTGSNAFSKWKRASAFSLKSLTGVLYFSPSMCFSVLASHWSKFFVLPTLSHCSVRLSEGNFLSKTSLQDITVINLWF